jgi:hypothetical protein
MLADMTARRFISLAAIALLAVLSTFAQPAKPTSKPTSAKKSPPPFTFEAHNEGSIEGAIYGAENLVSVTIDVSGIHYQAKSGKDTGQPVSISWDQVSDWQPNIFARGSGSSGAGDFGIGIHQDAHYFSFRTRSSRDFAAAVKALRVFASAKERPGIG